MERANEALRIRLEKEEGKEEFMSGPWQENNPAC